MREINASLGGRDITLRATFAAATEIAQMVADPIAFAREANIAAAMPGYVPKVTFTVANLPILIWIGMKAAGGVDTLQQVQAMVFDAGFPQAMSIADGYLALIVAPKSERPADAAEMDASPGE